MKKILKNSIYGRFEKLDKENRKTYKGGFTYLSKDENKYKIREELTLLIHDNIESLNYIENIDIFYNEYLELKSNLGKLFDFNLERIINNENN